MDMTSREKQVLGVIIDYYLTYGDTIGSRTLVKKYDIGVSSATIRNVMADLEDMGYIEKTHTSSGRIPTDRGYKFYLEELLKIEKLSKEEMKRIDVAYERRVNELESVLKKTSSLLSKMTSYAGIVIEPDLNKDRIKKIELVHIENYYIMAVVVSENLSVKTKKIHLENPITREELEEVGRKLNQKIVHGELRTHEQVEEYIKGHSEDNVVDELERELYKDMEGYLFSNNTTSIFKDRNVGDVGETLELFNSGKGVRGVFEKLVRSKNHGHGEVNVAFGDELDIHGLENLSFVYSTYKVGSSQGIIGVIGPRRMAYSKTMGLVNYVAKEVNKVIVQIEEKKEKS